MQPVSGGQYLRVAGTAAGTTVVRAHSANLLRVIIPADKTGTVSFYDVATGAGTTAANLVMAVPNTVGTIPTALEVGAQFNEGIVAVHGGTVDFTLVVN